MKKICIFISLILLINTGCANKTDTQTTPKDTLLLAIENMKELDSYNEEISTIITTGGSGINATVETVTFKDCYKSLICHGQITTKSLDEKQENEFYVVNYDLKNIVYTDYEDYWYKEEKELSSFDMKDFVNNASSIEKVISNDEFDKYLLKTSKEELVQLLPSYETSDDEGYTYIYDIDEESSKTHIYLDKNKYVVQMTFEVVGRVSYSIYNMKYSLTMDSVLKNFNEIDEIVIPEKIQKEALDEQIVKAYYYAYEYLSEAYMTNEKRNTLFTSLDIEYDGPKPTDVNFKIVNYNIVSGNITVAGYDFIVKDNAIDIKQITAKLEMY